MNPIRVTVTQKPGAPEEPSEGCHLKVQYGSAETTSEITADAVQELLKINKSIKWCMEEFVIHLPFQEPKAQEVSRSLAKYAALLIEALCLDSIAPERGTSHVIIHIKEDAVINPGDAIDIGALRWEVLQNENLWSGEARPASVSVVRLLGAAVEEVPVSSSTEPESAPTFNILALTARPRNVDDIPHRLITKSIYGVVEKANTNSETYDGSTGEQRATLSIVRPGSLDALKRELNRGKRYDIVHLDLHGKVEYHRAYALFINEIKRDAHSVSAEDLAELLSSHGVRTVVLNACQSAVEGEGTAANLAKALIQNGIQMVVAMAYKVLDVTARLFVCSFYDQLLRLNKSPLLAVQAARQCLLNKRTKKTNYLTEVPLDDYLVPSVYIGAGGVSYVTRELSISDLEMLRTSPPELPPDVSVDIDVNLVGREGDLLMLEMDLLLESCVMAIEGPPGVGKSALIDSAADWWKSTAFVDRVIKVGLPTLQSPESLAKLLNEEFGTDLTASDTQLEDVEARGRHVRTKIRKALKPAGPKRKGDARRRVVKPAKVTRETARKRNVSMQDSRLLVIFDGVEASGPRKISEPVLELMGYFLAVFWEFQRNIARPDLGTTSQEPAAPDTRKSFVVVTTRRMPEIAILNPPATSPKETGHQTHRPVRILAPLDEDRALLLTRYILEKTNRHPDVKDWEGLLVRGQLSKLAQGNPLALKILLSAFNPKDHNLVGFVQSLLRGDSMRLGSISLETDHGALPDFEQAVGDVRRLLNSADKSSTAIEAFYPFWAPFQLQTLQDYLSYIDFEFHKDKPREYELRENQTLVDQCVVFGDQELKLLYNKNQELPSFNSDSAMTIMKPFIDEGFVIIGNVVDRQVKSENNYVTLHPLIPLLLRDESHKGEDAYNKARKTAHDVMPKLFRYRIKKWPKRAAYWKREWDSPREILRWEFYDFLGAAYRVLDMPSSILTTIILIDMAHITNKGLFWDAGRRPLMGAFWRTAVDSMHQARNDMYEASRQPGVVPVNDWLLRLLGDINGSRGGVNFRILVETQTEILRMQHALSIEMAEMAFCLALVDYNTRQDEDAAYEWFKRLKKTYHARTKVPGADSTIRHMFDDMLEIMEASSAAPNPTQNFSDKQMATKAAARTTVFQNFARTGFDISGYDAGAWKAAALKDKDSDEDDEDDGTSHGMLGLGSSLLGRDEGVFVAILLARRKMEARPPNIAEARRLLYKAFSNDLEVGDSPANAASIHRALSEVVEEKAARLASKGKTKAPGQATEAVKGEEETQRDYWRRALYHWEQALQVESDAGFEKPDDQVQQETERTELLKKGANGIENAFESGSHTPASASSSKRNWKDSRNPLKSWIGWRIEKRLRKLGIVAKAAPKKARVARDSKRAASGAKTAESKAESSLKADDDPDMMQLKLMALRVVDKGRAEGSKSAIEPKPVKFKPSRTRSLGKSMSEDKIADAKEKFSLTATNGEYITPNDLATLFRSMGQQKSSQEIQEMIDNMDTSGRGVVDFDDFLDMEQINEPVDTEQELREAFDVFDMDKDGFISPAELRHQMQLIGEKLTDDEINDMIQMADLDGNGKIDYSEFVLMMRGESE
ncbi:hypothetical protein E0Z10_g9851 [Xylaria hypoxylon]|uniref:Calmodulin n=1 Tax=Xylaria hypoxylon TaxID=37992 RepID=A0A4Z0YJQ5_9PEZI|nr:hypothetical protein E0Z10_g9851 [Xylaria hypoxylon]